MNEIIYSPIRYIGGKRVMFKEFFSLLPTKVTEIISPFFGGGGIELNLALRGITVYGGDNYEPLINFWEHWIRSPEAVVNAAINVLELYDNNEIKRLGMIEDISVISKDVFGAGMFFLLNQLSFSGKERCYYIYEHKLRADGEWVHFGDKKYKHGRPMFRLREFWFRTTNLPINIERLDAFDLLDKYPNHFAFIDPPYPDVKGYYGKTKDSHEMFNHKKLRDILMVRNEWILTYNDIPYIRELYKDFKILSWKRLSGMQKGNRNELMIMSHDISQDQLLLF